MTEEAFHLVFYGSIVDCVVGRRMDHFVQILYDLFRDAT